MPMVQEAQRVSIHGLHGTVAARLTVASCLPVSAESLLDKRK